MKLVLVVLWVLVLINMVMRWPFSYWATIAWATILPLSPLMLPDRRW